MELREVRRPRRDAAKQLGRDRARASWRYATAGTSDYTHRDSALEWSTEVYAATRERALWILDLLAGVGSYPQQYGTKFVRFETLRLGRPVHDDSDFTFLLFAPAGLDDPASIEVVGATLAGGPVVHVEQIAGITARECEFAIERGGEALWERLLALGLPLWIDEPRPQAV